MVREGELTSPQNKLKDIFHIFKRNDQKVTGDLIPAQACHDKPSTTADAAPTLEVCAGGAGSEQPAVPAHQLQQPAAGSSPRDSASTLDAFGRAAVASTDGQLLHNAVAQPAAAAAPAAPKTHESKGSSSSGSPARDEPCGGPHTAQGAAGQQATSMQSTALGCQEGGTSCRLQDGQEHAAAAAAEQAPAHILGQAAASAQQQRVSARQAGASAAVLHRYAAATHMHSEPCPASSGGGGGRAASAAPRKVLCASVDDLYQQLFGDVPLPSGGSSSTAHSPFEGPLCNLRGKSSMSPMTTSSAFCHQQAAAAAIAGGGGMPGIGPFLQEGAASPLPLDGNSNSCRSSFDRQQRAQSPYESCAAAGNGYGGCAGGAVRVVQTQQPLGDMLPPGAYPPRLRLVAQPRSSRCSGSDGGSSSLFPDESPSCCSSSAGGQAWPATSMEEGGSFAVSTLSTGLGCDSRGSQRYSSPAAGPVNGAQSAPGASSDSKPAPKSSLRTRWTNWINSSNTSGGDGGSSSCRSSPGAQSPRSQHLQAQHRRQTQQPHEASGAHSPKRDMQVPQSAPGKAADQSLYASAGGRAGNGSRAAGHTLLPLQPLAHCHSNPELVQAAAHGSVGHGRGHFQRSSGLGAGVPPCARSLFGSVPQMERPLVMGGGAGNSSSGWLSGPGGVGFGAPPRTESYGVLAGLGACDDAVSVASADEEVIRQVNADNVLSTAWGPGSHSASGGGLQGGLPGAASHPKLLAFKYCCATSPLNHPGRSSPFNSARNSPYNSPRGTRDSVVDLLPLRSSAVATAAASCPGSPLGARHSNNPFSCTSSTAAITCTPAAAAKSTCAPASASSVQALQQPQQQEQPQQGCTVLKKQSSSSSQVLLEPTASSTSDQQQLDGSDPGAACSSSGGSNSSSKPPLQGRPVRGLLRTPPPALPLPLKAATLPAAAQGLASDNQQHCCSSGIDGDVSSASQADRGSSAAGAEPARGAGLSSSRRVSAPAGLSALMMRFSSSSSGSGSSNNSPAVNGSHAGGSSHCQAPGLATQGSSASTTPQSAAAVDASEPAGGLTACAGSSSCAGRASGHSLPLVLPSCSTDTGSPKQQLQATSCSGAADSRCSPRRQSSSRLGASGGFTTPSRLSHNSTMAEALVTGSAGGGSGSGGFALHRTSSCCSSSSGWPSAGGGKLAVGGRSSSGAAPALAPAQDGVLLSTTSVPLPTVYHRGQGSVNCSDSSDGSWAEGQVEYCTAPGTVLEQGARQQPDKQPCQGVAWPRGGVACLSAQPATAAVDRYDSVNGASDASVGDCQECSYPSWCSSNCWSPHVAQQEHQTLQAEQHQAPLPQQRPQQHMPQQEQHEQQDSGGSGLQGAADAAEAPSCAGGAGPDNTAAAEAAIPPSLPEVDFLEKIGRGSFGDVFKGVWCGSVVAVKVIQVKQPSALTFPTRHPSQPGQQQQRQQQPEPGDALGTSPGAADPDGQIDSQAAQVALELAQHEYESWLNANLRHPNIVQLFTSFTIGLEERGASMPGALFGPGVIGGTDGGRGGTLGCTSSSSSSGLSWRTHLVMEHCELGTMQDLLQRGVLSHGALPEASHLCWVLATAKEFCTAVAYLHSMDVVHGDLKSSNVLLKAAAATAWDSRGFVAKVSDFGLSRVMDAISAANGEPCVTSPAAAAASGSCDASAGAFTEAPAGGAGDAAAGGSLGWQPCQPRFGALSHAAPELIRGQQLSKASDVYSIGVLLWELLTGQAPFYGMHPGQLLSLKLSQHTSQLLPFPATAPAGLAQLCLDCWAAEPSERPSMAAVVQRINDLAVDLLGQEQAVAMFPDVAALAAQRRQAAAAAAAAGAAAAGALAGGC